MKFPVLAGFSLGFQFGCASLVIFAVVLERFPVDLFSRVALSPLTGSVPL